MQKRKCSPQLPALLSRMHARSKVRVVEKPLDLSLKKKNPMEFDSTESSSDDSAKINVAKALCALQDPDNLPTTSGETSQQQIPMTTLNKPENSSNVSELSTPSHNVQDMNLVFQSSSIEQPIQTMIPLCQPSTSRQPVRFVNLVNQSSGFLPYSSGGLFPTHAPFTSEQLINVSHDTSISQNTFVPIRAPMLMNQNMPFCPITTIGSLASNPFTQGNNFSSCLPIYTGNMNQNMTAMKAIPVTAVDTSVGIESSGSLYGTTTSTFHAVSMTASTSTGLTVHDQSTQNVQPMTFDEQHFIDQSVTNQADFGDSSINNQTIFHQFFDNLLENVDPSVFDPNEPDLIGLEQNAIVAPETNPTDFDS